MLRLNWWESSFDENLGLFLDRDNDPDTAATIAFLTGKLNIKPGDPVFDQCCGCGRVGVEYMHLPQVVANFRENYTRTIEVDNTSRGHTEKDYMPLKVAP